MTAVEGLIEALEDDSVSFKDRLDLANKAFIAAELKVQNKEIVILTWIGKKCTSVSDNLWSLMKSWLVSDHFENINRSRISDQDIESFLEVFSCKLLEVDPQETHIKELVLDCLKAVFQNRTFHQFFRYNVKFYCEFASSVIQGMKDKDLFLRVVCSEYIYAKAIICEEQFPRYFIEYNLPDLVTKLELYSDINVFEALSQVVSKCIYAKNLKHFELFLKKIFGEDVSIEKHNVCKQLFKYLVSTYRTETSGNVAFKLLFQSFCNSYSKRMDLIYMCSIFMFEIIGFDLSSHFVLNKTSRYTVQDSSLKKSVEILSSIINVLTAYTGICSHSIGDVTFLEVITGLSKSLVTLTKSPDESCYKLFIDIMDMNPLIIESIIEDIIPYAMLCDNSMYLINYEMLMISIFGIYAKLHRVQNLVSKMMMSLKAALNKEDTKESQYSFKGVIDISKRNFEYNYDIFTDSMLIYFSQCITNQASWQIINLFKTLSFHLKAATSELHDIKHGLLELVYIEFVSTLMCSLLSSVRIAEHTVAQNVVEKFIKEMEVLKEILTNFGKSLLKKEHNCILMKSFLHICYTWGEVYMMLAYYSEGRIDCKGQYDSNISACNITYLHPYLSVSDWCLISERITNFGEKPCKLIMQKLFCQKLHAMMIFEHKVKEELKNPVAKTFCLNLNESWELVITDKFIINNLLGYFAISDVVNLAEYCLHDVVNENKWKTLDQMYLLENQLIRNAFVYVTCSSINQLMKQKRKLDENFIWKPMSSRILSIVSPEHFISEDIEITVELDKIKNVFHQQILQESEPINNISININSLTKYLDVLEKLPIIFGSKGIQTVFMFYIFSLHKDCHQLKEFDLKDRFERLIIGIFQQNKIDLTDVVSPPILIQYLAEYFKHIDTFYTIYLEHLIKSEKYIVEFEAGVKFLGDNIKKPEYLPLCIHVLNAISKWKKHKQTPTMKIKIEEYNTVIQKKLLKVLVKGNVDSFLVEPYAVLLKMALSKPEDETLEKLKSRTDLYFNYAVCDNGDNKGAVLLFTTILRHKSDLKLNDTIYLQVWNKFNLEKLSYHMIDEYSPLIQLIFENVPNDDFQEITKALSAVMKDIVQNKDFAKLSAFVKIWLPILSSNFNPTKLKIWQEMLENVMLDIFMILNDLKHDHVLLHNIVTFVNCIVQAVHLPLTPSMCDILLMFPPALLGNKNTNFNTCYTLAITLMGSLLKYHKVLMMDRLPAYLQGYKVLLQKICEHGNSDLNLTIDEIHLISDCAHGLEKLTNNIIACKKDMTRISCFLIAEILGNFEKITLFPAVKKHLDNCIYSLISLYDQHTLSYLMRALSSASTELFKIMYENYKKYYKFTGKV